MPEKNDHDEITQAVSSEERVFLACPNGLQAAVVKDKPPDEQQRDENKRKSRSSAKSAFRNVAVFDEYEQPARRILRQKPPEVCIKDTSLSAYVQAASERVGAVAGQAKNKLVQIAGGLKAKAASLGRSKHTPPQGSARAAGLRVSEAQVKPKAVPVAEPEAVKPKATPVAEPEAVKPKAVPVAEPEAVEPKATPVAKPEAVKPKVTPVAEPEAVEPKAVPVAEPEAVKPKATPVAEPEAVKPKATPVAEPEVPAKKIRMRSVEPTADAQTVPAAVQIGVQAGPKQKATKEAKATKVKKQKKKRTVFGTVKTAVLWVLVGAVVVMAMLLGGVRIFGITPFAIQSGSMTPQYPVGCLVYTCKVDPAKLNVGDVITFAADETTLVTHRIDQIDRENGLIYTKGDANAERDNVFVPYENVVGKVMFSVPELGKLSVYLSTRSGRFAIVAVVAALVLAYVLPELILSFKEAPGGRQKQTQEG